MQKSQNILLISYVFPPYPGIGGRRWAKFAKHLAQKGYTIHVICAKNPLSQTSLFSIDIQHSNIKTYELPALYPTVLVKDLNSLFDKLLYRMSLFFLKLFVKGNYYDRGTFWKKKLLKQSYELIAEHNIKNVIITGAPFSLLSYGIEFKKKFPEINLIGDLRDPWTWGVGYGMQSISAKRKEIESNREHEVIESYDLITVPSEEMKGYLTQKYPLSKQKITLLPHGFDTGEIQVLPKKESDKVRLVFYGTIYSNLENSILQLANFISKHEVHLDIYSPSTRYSKYFDQKKLLNKQVRYHAPREPRFLFDSFSNYDYVLVIQPDFAKDHITTKIYEIIYSKTPIILIAGEGKLSRFVAEHNVGIHILPEQIEDQMSQLLKRSPEKFSWNTFSIKEFSFEQLTNNIIRHIK